MSLIGRIARGIITMPYMSISNPDDWLYEAFGGGLSDAGNRVTRDKALTYSPVWRGVSLLSADVGKLPLYVYRRNGDNKERDTEHPAYRLLRHKPNREMSAMVFRQTLQAHALLDGNGMAYIARDGSGRPTELIPLLPGRASPIRVNGELWYYTMISSITGETAPAENVTVRYLDASSVLHIRGLGFNGLTGYPLYQYARNSMGLGLAAQQYASTFFSNGAAPSVVFEHPGKMSDKAKLGLSEAWKSRHEGLGKQHRTAILEEGMKLHAFGVDPDKSQLLELRQHQIREMANWLGLPPHKLGDTTRTAYASLEQENQAYLDDALDPWLVKWEEECREKLLTEQEKNTDSHVIEFMRQALVRANLAARAQFYNLAIQGGWMNRDEVRARENMNAIPNGAGAEFLRPLNMTPASAEPAEPTEPDEIPVAKPTRKRKAKVTP